MKKLFSTRIGAILMAVAMLVAILPGTMAVMAAGEVTGDGAYIAVNELEHYVLTVDNSTVSDQVISVTVNFWKQGEGNTYSPITINAYKSYNTTAADTTSVDRFMYGESNTFNFTTPKDCDYITVTAVDDTTKAVLSLPLSVEVTDEVLNNGVLSTGKETRYVDKAVPGWYVNYANYNYDGSLERFDLENNTSVQIYQSLTLKAGVTYRLKFKYAQKAAEGEALKYDSPQLYFDSSTGTNGTLVSRGSLAKAKILTAAPTSESDWTEYEVLLVAPDSSTKTGMSGLCQTRMIVRHYAAGVEGKTEGVEYYDDFSIEEVSVSGENEYMEVEELEHYELSIENSDASDKLLTATVNFWKKEANNTYSPIIINVRPSNATRASETTNLSKYIYGEDNIFNFTTPKGCEYVTVSITDGDEKIALPINLEVTNEVMNNGSLINTSGVGATDRTAGWYISNTAWYDEDMNYLAMSSASSTNVFQNATLKEGKTYRFSFKYAQKEAEGENLSSEYPQLYFGIVSTGAEIPSIPTAGDRTTAWEVAPVLETAPSSTDWKEYEIYFVVTKGSTDTGMAGLAQVQMIPRNYTSSGAVYYDDFSLEEVDEGSYIGYIKDSGVSVSGKSNATKIRYHYVKDADDRARNFIYAEYDGDKKLSYVKLIPVSTSGDYEIEIDDKTLSSKIFLLDSQTIAPLMNAIEE